MDGEVAVYLQARNSASRPIRRIRALWVATARRIATLLAGANARAAEECERIAARAAHLAGAKKARDGGV